MKNLFLIIIFFLLRFISIINIDIDGIEGIYNFTIGETYNFYLPVEQLVEISIDFKFDNYTYLPFENVFINEYSSRNGTSIRKYTIKHFNFFENQKYYYYSFYYDIENFISTYVSLSIKPNITIDNVEIIKSFYGGVYNISNRVAKNIQDLYEETPFYLTIHSESNSKIKVKLKITPNEYRIDLTFTLIEYQKNNSGYYICELYEFYYEGKGEDYDEDEDEDDDDKMIISFNYLIKNKNTNLFCLNFVYYDYAMDYLEAKFNEDKYYFNLSENKSLELFDLKPNNNYHFQFEDKALQLLNINYSILLPDLNDTQIPLKYIDIYEEKKEFSSFPLKNRIQYITKLSDSFEYAVSEENANYLLLNITPLVYIKAFNFSYNLIKEITTTPFNLEKNVSLDLPELYQDISYVFNIKSKVLQYLKLS